MAEPTRTITRLLLLELDCLRRAGVRYLRSPQRGAQHTARTEGVEARAETTRTTNEVGADRPCRGKDLDLPDPRRSTELTLPNLDRSGAASRRSAEPEAEDVKGTTMLEPAEGWETPVLSTSEKLAKLAELEERVSRCTRCPELVQNRTQTVFGVGNPDAELCFVGEAPGADEDRLGEPFVGRAGQLLTRMIEAMAMKRSDVYICNVLKCRPPQNRTPTVIEVRNCADYLDEQLEIIKPAFICCLGSVAAQRLITTPGTRSSSIGRLRGRIFRYKGAKVIVTYHPAYLLRNESAKKDAWQDLKLLLKEMGRPIPSRRKR